MKKILGIVFIILIITAGNAFGTASSITDNFANGVYPSKNNGKSFVVLFSCTADSTNGTFTSTASSGPINAYITRVVTNPGTTSPTDNYDITLTDSDSVDVMGGTLANRDETNSEQARPYDSASGTYGDVYVDGTITVNISGNSVPSATLTIAVYCERP